MAVRTKRRTSSAKPKPATKTTSKSRSSVSKHLANLKNRTVLEHRRLQAQARAAAKKATANETPPPQTDEEKTYTVAELREIVRNFDPSKMITSLKARRRLSRRYEEGPYRITTFGMPDPWTVIALLARADLDVLCERGGADFADAVCRLPGFVMTGYISRNVQRGYATLLIWEMWRYRDEKISLHYCEAIARELCRLFHASQPPDLCGDEEGHFDILGYTKRN